MNNEKKHELNAMIQKALEAVWKFEAEMTDMAYAGEIDKDEYDKESSALHTALHNLWKIANK